MTKLEQAVKNQKSSLLDGKTSIVKLNRQYTEEEKAAFLKKRAEEKESQAKWTKDWVVKHKQALKTQGWT